MHTFPEIDRFKAMMDQHHPLDPAIVRNLREDLIVRWTYHSNAIEGNTLTLQETKVALEGITIGGKSIREHLEAVNHKNAILLLEDLVQKHGPVGATLKKAAVRTCTIRTVCKPITTNPSRLSTMRNLAGIFLPAQAEWRATR
jgi:Fic family protein